MWKSTWWCILIFCVSYVNCARILAIVPTPSYSHQVAFHLIWKELSLRGHQVTLLTTDPIKDPTLTNLTEIDLHFTYDTLDVTHNMTKLIDIAQTDSIGFVRKFTAALRDAAGQQLEHPEVQKLIRKENGQEFDLVMAEFFHPTMFAFSKLYECPLISIASLEPISVSYHSMGSPAHPVLHPDVILPFVTPLNFFERVVSTLYVVFLKFYVSYAVIPQENRSIRKYFGENFSTADEVKKRVSLMFVNVDPIFNVIRPLVPTIIPIGGGSHINECKPLPKDLKKFLDGAHEGVIYFSLGSNVKRVNIDDSTIETILKTFSELPYKVLWKIDVENFANRSENVRLVPWVSQQDVLKHPNVKVFITQGGWQSIQEAIYSHVPMVGLPFFADQPPNIKKVAARGIALSLDHKTLTVQEFKETILEVMLNPKYRNKIRELAELAQDQPMTGLEKAIWWTEYVLRHKGAKHLRSPVLDLPSYQYYLLDVIAFCAAVVILLLLILIRATKLIFKAVKYLNSGPKLKKM